MNWFDAQAIIDSFGDWAAIAISVVLFIETAFVPLSFLPGDSLLFLGGLALSNSDSFLPDWSGFLIIWFGAFFGSQVGFWLGKQFEKSKLIKPVDFLWQKIQNIISHTHITCTSSIIKSKP